MGFYPVQNFSTLKPTSRYKLSKQSRYGVIVTEIAIVFYANNHTSWSLYYRRAFPKRFDLFSLNLTFSLFFILKPKVITMH